MKLFIFDMGGVVTTNASEVRGRPAAALGVTQEEMDRATGGLFDQLTIGKITTKEFWAAVGERLGKKIDTDYFHLFFHPVLNKETKKIILDLRKKGFRVVCGTNTIQSHYLNHMTRGDYAIFDQTYASQLMGAKKPDPLFWKLILDAEKCEPSDAFFTDDLEANVQAATALGIHAVQFTDAKKLRADVREFLKTGRIVLEPRELTKPFQVSANTLKVMDSSIKNLKKGRASAPIDLSAYEDIE